MLDSREEKTLTSNTAMADSKEKRGGYGEGNRTGIKREQSETLSANKDRFCNNSKIETLISKRISVEHKAKLSQFAIVNK